MNDAFHTYMEITKSYIDTVEWRRIRKSGNASIAVHEDVHTSVEKEVDTSVHRWNGAKVYWTFVGKDGRMTVCWDGGRYQLIWDDETNSASVVGSDRVLVEARLRGLYLYISGDDNE